jgi:hypothetical protein
MLTKTDTKTKLRARIAALELEVRRQNVLLAAYRAKIRPRIDAKTRRRLHELHDVEGRSYATIARRMGFSRRSVIYHVGVARQQLGVPLGTPRAPSGMRE